MNYEQFKNELQHFTGSEQFYRYKVGSLQFIFTEGVKYVCDTCQSYWLLDVILSYQIYEKFQQEEFQTWTLWNEGGKATITADDGNKNIFANRKLNILTSPFWG